ncbi:heavy metal-associated domain-containing protein, partial [Streptomyces sp. NPDC048491]|uniref:heavy metal-associated domain-containing protein n=1 Tax=Streptomyces sp. NPDC048491 TaxID=3157207 RepID=UPI0034134601
MTCAACASRIEKKLNRMPGVTATVNYATEKARVAFGEGVDVDDVIAMVVKTGYTAERRPTPFARQPTPDGQQPTPPERHPTSARPAFEDERPSGANGVRGGPGSH